MISDNICFLIFLFFFVFGCQRLRAMLRKSQMLLSGRDVAKSTTEQQLLQCLRIRETICFKNSASLAAAHDALAHFYSFHNGMTAHSGCRMTWR